MATGSTLGISAENSKDTPAPPGQQRAQACVLPPLGQEAHLFQPGVSIP